MHAHPQLQESFVSEPPNPTGAHMHSHTCSLPLPCTIDKGMCPSHASLVGVGERGVLWPDCRWLHCRLRAAGVSQLLAPAWGLAWCPEQRPWLPSLQPWLQPWLLFPRVETHPWRRAGLWAAPVQTTEALPRTARCAHPSNTTTRHDDARRGASAWLACPRSPVCPARVRAILRTKRVAHACIHLWCKTLRISERGIEVAAGDVPDVGVDGDCADLVEREHRNAVRNLAADPGELQQFVLHLLVRLAPQLEQPRLTAEFLARTIGKPNCSVRTRTHARTKRQHIHAAVQQSPLQSGHGSQTPCHAAAAPLPLPRC